MKIGQGVSELWRVENRPLPLTWPMAYTTACTTVQAVIQQATCARAGNVYKVAQKSKPLPNDQKIVLNQLKPVNEFRFIRQIKVLSSTMILHMYSLVLDILCVSYFLGSIIMRDRQTGDMRQIRQMMSALSLASARFSKL